MENVLQVRAAFALVLHAAAELHRGIVVAFFIECLERVVLDLHLIPVFFFALIIQLFQVAAVECVLSYVFQAERKVDVGQAAAARKSVRLDLLHALGQYHVQQQCA